MRRLFYRNGDDITLIHTGCDGCTPTTIGGILVHELGCPESWRDQHRKCKECGDTFYPLSRYQGICESCTRDNYGIMEDAL